ncbi:MAG TPA: hypothetical protein VHD36_12000 [Pirellulales bacterium]|nr:hypothetical protein [Pirellulales bacterium]
MNNDELRTLIRQLRAIRAGTIFESHHCRAVLIEARRLETRLDKALSAVFDARRRAEEQFCLGWPDAKGAPWRLE